MFWHKIKEGVHKMGAVVAMAALASAIFLPFTQAKAAEAPQFNFLQGDKEIVSGSNATAGETSYHNPVVGTAGDTFEAVIYYHNGKVGTTAHNTKIRVDLPKQTTNNAISVSATISADNAFAVNQTTTNGKLVGQRTLINELNAPATVAIIPSSLQWMPNAPQTGNAVMALPNGQTENDLIGAGINIGDINGCWQYQGYVRFQYKTTPVVLPTGTLTFDKDVRNVTNSESFLENTTAHIGDELEYRLDTTANTAALNGVVVKDTLPSDISYVNGSLKVKNNATGKFVALSDAVAGQLLGSGYNVGTLNVGTANMNEMTFRAKVNSTKVTTLTNKAQSTAGALLVSDSAVTTVILPVITPVGAAITLNKVVRDVTANELSFVEADQAKAGDTLEYKINFSNTGDTAADSVTISDTLPANVSYVAGSTQISLDGAAATALADGLTAAGINIGSVGAGKAGYITFRAVISASAAANQTLTNIAYFKFGTSNISDPATTTVVTKVVLAAATSSTPLPKTGAETEAVALLGTIASAVGATFLKYKGLLAKKIAKF